MAVVLLDTDDLDEAEAALSAAFSKIHIDAPYRGESGSMRIERSHVGSIAADSVDYGWDFSFGMEALEQILLCGVVSGGIEERLPRRRPAHLGPGDVLAAGAIDGFPITRKVEQGI